MFVDYLERKNAKKYLILPKISTHIETVSSLNGYIINYRKSEVNIPKKSRNFSRNKPNSIRITSYAQQVYPPNLVAFVVKTIFKLRNFVAFDVKQHIN